MNLGPTDCPHRSQSLWFRYYFFKNPASGTNISDSLGSINVSSFEIPWSS